MLLAMISGCHLNLRFYLPGISLILKKYGIDASHIHFEEMMSPNGSGKYPYNQHAHIVVFPGKGIVTLLESLTRLASVLNALPLFDA
jgi:hypothetical protein